jgi:2-polyprenyl-3-methyl-5-hydroxy-6-metoxy-1,4-benzoquinol methylase
VEIEREDLNAGPDDDPVQRPSSGYRPHSAAVYSTDIDTTQEVGAHGIVLRMIGSRKRVLELGCAAGSVTKVLADRGCRVTGIEIDPDAAQTAKEWAEEVIVGDLDTMDIAEALAGKEYDVILAADVLEHLRDPKRCVQACLEQLAPGGEVVLSIPNVAHADVRLALLDGRFDYRPLGLLDETHLRFFTRESLERFLRDSGLTSLTWERTVIGVGGSEVEWDRSVDETVVRWVSRQPDADTYQFVLRAALAPPGSHLREVADQRDELTDELRRLRPIAERVPGIEAENDQLKVRVEALEVLAQKAAGIRSERDEYKAAFDALADLQDELVAVRRSETYRLGQVMLRPLVLLRRVLRAWKQAKH